jgi:hypothetical protein
MNKRPLDATATPSAQEMYNFNILYPLYTGVKDVKSGIMVKTKKILVKTALMCYSGKGGTGGI